MKKTTHEDALLTGNPLTVGQLAQHLRIDSKHTRRIARSLGLEPEGRTYPWRRIWRAIHGIEGALLPMHLAELKSAHPNSVILSNVSDLETAMRTPLMTFSQMASQLGKNSDTLSKALLQGRETLPFPILELAPRKRHFRELEVRLWVDEEIRLDLPTAVNWATAKTSQATEASPREATAAACLETHAQDASSQVDPATKAIFGGFAAVSGKAPT